MKRIALALGMLAALLGAAAAQVVALPTTSLSSTIAVGNTFQGIVGLAALGGQGQSRKSVTIQNNNTTTDNCWLFIGPTANATKALAILLAPGQSYSRYYPYVPSDNFAITCLNGGDSFYADRQ